MNNSINKRSKTGAELTVREREVLFWVIEGKTNYEIAVILGIKQDTVKEYLSNVLKKLDAVNRTHAAALAYQSGIVSIQ